VRINVPVALNIHIAYANWNHIRGMSIKQANARYCALGMVIKLRRIVIFIKDKN